MQPSYDDTFSYINLVNSAEKSIKNVLWKKSVQMFASMLYIWCSKLYSQLKSKAYKSKGFTKFFIKERGKVRDIQSVHISERVVQKALCEYALKPIIEKSLIFDNAASLPGKGLDFAIKRFREHLRWHYAKYGLQGGILIGDFHNFFASIDQNTLLIMLREKIKDDDIYELTEYFIRCFDKGLGLGSEVSQICAIFYPNKIDHMVKEQYQIHGYARYMDDFYVISEDICKLNIVFNAIRSAAKELNLDINEKRTNIYLFKDLPTFTYLKCRTRLESNGRISMRLTRDNVKRRRKWIHKQKELVDDGVLSIHDVTNSQQIWEGYAKKRKNSFKTVQSTKQYFDKTFEEVPICQTMKSI